MRPETHVIVNPIAGGGRAGRVQSIVRDYLMRRNHPADFIESRGTGDLREQAEQAAAAGDEARHAGPALKACVREMRRLSVKAHSARADVDPLARWIDIRESHANHIQHAEAVISGSMDRFDRVPRDSQRSGDVVAVYRREKPRVTVTEADLKEILSTVRTRKYTILFALLAGTGLRIGEALALRPTDFGPDCRVLHIRRSIWRGQEQQPKTANALRVLDLPEVLAKELRNFVGASMAISSQPRKANHYSDEMSCEFYTA